MECLPSSSRVWNHMSRCGVAAGALAIWLGTGPVTPLAAEDPKDTFSDSTTTTLVEIPVEVTLENEPVRGLGVEDFEVWDDGKRVSLVGLDVVDLSVIGTEVEDAAEAREMPVAARRHFLLLFDMSFASPAAITRAREAAADLVRDDLHPTDLVSVATYSLNSGARLALGFTSDRQQVEVAISALSAPDSVKVRADPLRLYVGTPTTGDIGEDRAIQGGASGERGAMIEGQGRLLQMMADRAQANQGRREISSMTRSLSELAEMLQSIDGRKHVVFFSEGFDGDLLLGATDQGRRDEMVRRAQDNALWEVDSSEYFGSADTLAVLDDMVQTFRRADCAIHSVDVGGLRTGAGAVGASGGGKDGLFMMASNTGGSFYDNFNDLGQAMGRMLEKTSVTYVLRYQPAGLEANGEYRKLKVEVRDLPRKARVSHRPGYFAPDTSRLPSTAEMQLRLAQRLLDGRSGGSIGVGILPSTLRRERSAATGDAAGEGWSSGRAYVPVLVEVDGASFLAEDARRATPAEKRGEGRKRKRGRRSAAVEKQRAEQDHLMRAEVFLYAMAADGSIADFYAQSVELDQRNVGEALRRRGFKLYAPLLLDPGVYDLRILVRNSRTGRTGLTVSPLEVPELGAASAVLLPPLFPEATEEWILVRGHRNELEGEAEPPYPYFHGGTTYVPAARPELTPGQVLPVFLAGYGLAGYGTEGGQGGGMGGLVTALLGDEGVPAATPRWKVDPRSMVGEDGLERYIAAFETPSVPAGDYVLELSIEGAPGEISSIGRLPIRVLGPGGSTAQRLLALSTSVSFDSAGPSTDLPRRAAPSERGRDDDRDALAMGDFGDAYRRALARLPVAGRATLVPELADLEARAVGKHPERRTARLARVEKAVARRLARRDPEVLVPMMLLHQDLYLEHEIRRRPHLGHHSRQMVPVLADLYVEMTGSEGARIMAARVLSSLGGHLQADGRLASLELFEHALRFDPSSEAALLGLAAFHEKRGGPYGQVVEYLETLVSQRPASREGRLRLAVNQLRLASVKGALDSAGLAASARRHFETLLAEGEGDWIHSLAAQELARWLARSGSRERGRAIEVLEEALDKMPDDQKLAIQLSFLLDRGAQAHRARRLAERVVVSRHGGGGVGEAARGRYNRWPEKALAADRRELALGARQRLAVLASAVGGTRAEASSVIEGGRR